VLPWKEIDGGDAILSRRIDNQHFKSLLQPCRLVLDNQNCAASGVLSPSTCAEAEIWLSRGPARQTYSSLYPVKRCLSSEKALLTSDSANNDGTQQGGEAVCTERSSSDRIKNVIVIFASYSACCSGCSSWNTVSGELTREQHNRRSQLRSHCP
jgi:hypothetical protein